SSTEFQYNGLSQRVRVIEKSAANTTISDKRYLWAGGNQPTEERDSSGTTVLKRYFQQGEQIPAAAAPLDKLFYTKDHLGSIRELTDSNGALQTRYDYDMWGKRVKLSGTLDTEVGYTGHHHHAKSGLVLTWYRVYDAEVGRWLSPDPLESVTGEMAELLAEGSNLYGYGPNNPINGYDPDGLLWWPITGLIGGAVDFGLQMAMNGGNIDCVDWGDVGISAATSAVGFGLVANVGKVKKAMKAKKTLERLGKKRVPEKAWSNYANSQKADALSDLSKAKGIPAAIVISQSLKAGNNSPGKCP
ncbi:MAG: RHS repeat domain-containing protein, partial [Akkermansiaceae bacterium]